MEWLAEITQEYGLFVALVAYVLWEKRQERNKYIEREDKYIEREAKYIGLIGNLSESYQSLKQDLTDIKNIMKGG